MKTLIRVPSKIFLEYSTSRNSSLSVCFTEHASFAVEIRQGIYTSNVRNNFI